MNGYARASRIVSDITGGSSSMAAIYARQSAEMSREWDSTFHRPMFATLATRYYTANALTPGEYGPGGRMLWTGDDLAAVTSLSGDYNNDGAFEVTFAEGTDYRLWPYNAASRGEPYRGLELVFGSTNGIFPVTPHGIKLVGLFGYSYELEAVLTSAGAAVSGTLSNAADTTLTITGLDATGLIDIGDTLVMGSEQLDVISTSYAASDTTVVVTRGINGTTAVGQSSIAIQRRRYPRDVEKVIADMVVRGRWDSQSGFQGADGGSTNRIVYANYMKLGATYQNPAAVV